LKSNNLVYVIVAKAIEVIQLIAAAVRYSGSAIASTHSQPASVPKQTIGLTHG
jgi:hypothetical protein